MPGRSGARRSPARYLAPVALLAVVAGTYLIVDHGLSTKSPRVATVKTPVHLTGTQRRYARHKFYFVLPGDSLTLIASKTGIPVGTLQALNPRIDPNALQPGQRLRIRR